MLRKKGRICGKEVPVMVKGIPGIGKDEQAAVSVCPDCCRQGAVPDLRVYCLPVRVNLVITNDGVKML